MAELKSIIQYARNLSSKPGIIPDAKFQPPAPKKAVRSKAPAAPAKIVKVKSSEIPNVFTDPSSTPEEIRIAEAVRNEITEMGISKFKSLDIKLIKDYYRQLTAATPPSIPKAKLVNAILSRLGLWQWGNVFENGNKKEIATAEKVQKEIKEIGNVDDLDIKDLRKYYNRLKGSNTALPDSADLTYNQLVQLVMERLGLQKSDVREGGTEPEGEKEPSTARED